MYYDMISITPDVYNKKWKIAFESIPLDRQKTGPHLPMTNFGLFHYPRKWKKDKAFNMLKAAMVKQHFDRLKITLQSLEALQQLELP